jgi:hypothetical protein
MPKRWLKAAEADAKEMVEGCKGYIHDRNYRPIVPLVVSLRDEARWVFDIVDTGQRRSIDITTFRMRSVHLPVKGFNC